MGAGQGEGRTSPGQMAEKPIYKAHIPRIKKGFQGMLECKEDELKLAKNLILELRPRDVAVNLIPGLPTFIHFMCLRHADYVDDEQKIHTLLTSTNSIKEILKKYGDDIETVSWLANTCRCLHCLKQYSGEQNKHCLSNFNLVGYGQVISDLAFQINQQLIKCMEHILWPIIKSEMLELLEAIHADSNEGTYTLDCILRQLGAFHSTMCQHGMDPELIAQVLRQLFYLIGAVTLHCMLLCKDMCTWREGRCKVSQLEEWLRDKGLMGCGAKETLEPLIQAAQLLQMKETDEDAEAICSLCQALTTSQIVKVLGLYTRANENEPQYLQLHSYDPYRHETTMMVSYC